MARYFITQMININLDV